MTDRIANVPEDPLRRAPMSFSEWVKSFEVMETEEQQRLCEAARTLLRTPVFDRVMSRVEARTMQMISRSSVDDQTTLTQAKLLLHGINAIRTELRVMAEEADYKDKTSKDQ